MREKNHVTIRIMVDSGLIGHYNASELAFYNFHTKIEILDMI